MCDTNEVKEMSVTDTDIMKKQFFARIGAVEIKSFDYFEKYDLLVDEQGLPNMVALVQKLADEKKMLIFINGNNDLQNIVESYNSQETEIKETFVDFKITYCYFMDEMLFCALTDKFDFDLEQNSK